MSNNISTLFTSWSQDESCSVIILQNKDHIPVASLHLNKLKCRLEDIILCNCESKTDEKYYLYLDGIAIFFTYYKKS